MTGSRAAVRLERETDYRGSSVVWDEFLLERLAQRRSVNTLTVTRNLIRIIFTLITSMNFNYFLVKTKSDQVRLISYVISELKGTSRLGYINFVEI